jgi:hypothetical protein
MKTLTPRVYYCGHFHEYICEDLNSLKQSGNLCVPPTLTLNNSAFRPQSVFVCLVWFSEQTAIISLNSINQLIFVMETCCIFFEAGPEFLNVIRASKCWKAIDKFLQMLNHYKCSRNWSITHTEHFWAPKVPMDVFRSYAPSNGAWTMKKTTYRIIKNILMILTNQKRNVRMFYKLRK